MTLGLFTCLNPGISLSKSAHRGAALSPVLHFLRPPSAAAVGGRGAAGAPRRPPPQGGSTEPAPPGGCGGLCLVKEGDTAPTKGDFGERKGRGAVRERRPPHRFCSEVPLRPEGATPDPTAKGSRGKLRSAGNHRQRDICSPVGSSTRHVGALPPPCYNTPLSAVSTREHAGRLDGALSEGLAFPAEVCDGTRVVLT